MSVRIGNKIVAGMPEKALHGIGEIFTTTDTGVIAGAVEANGGSYNLADYNSGADSIASKLAAGTLSYVSKTEFQTRVANTGACDSFGWNGSVGALYAWSPTPEDAPAGNPTVYANTPNPSVGENVYYTGGAVAGTIAAINNNIITVEGDAPGEFGRDSSNDIAGTPDPTFLVPKLNPWHVGKSAPVSANVSNLVFGDGGTIELVVGSPNISKNNPGGKNTLNTSYTPGGPKTISNMNVDLSETTNLRVMVQLATGATDQALETCTSVLADVSGLKDMSNVTATGKETIVGWGMPDYSAGISLSGWGTAISNFSVPTDGILQILISSTSAIEEFFVDDKIACALTNVSNYIGWAVNLFPVSKGTHTWRTSSTPSRIYAVVFYPFKGVN